MTSAVKTSNAHAEIYCQCQNLNCSSTFTLDATLSRCKPTQSKQEK
ncbi:ogr/Delta-like zinc finger family protein [Vibrio vulnificus]